MNRWHSVLLVVATGVTLSGCARDFTYAIGAPVLDSQFGDAVRRARAMQVIDPHGVTVSEQGYSGKAALTAMERYDAPAKIAPPSPTAAADLMGKSAK